MRTRLAIILLSTFIVFYTTLANAQDNAEWLADKAHLQKVVNEHKCEEYWNILWPWAKKGNLEARTLLAFYLSPPMHSDSIFPPGSSKDSLTRMRHTIILAVHGIGIKDKEYDWYNDALDKIFKQQLAPYGSSSFFKCLDENRTHDCTGIAVKEGLVPSFEDYVAEIDLLMAQGMKSTCSPYKQH